VAHLVSNLTGYDCLAEDVQAVLDSLIPKEAELQSRSGEWYLMRILPYRTLGNAIEGAVVTFVDVTARKRAEEALRLADQRLALIVRGSHDAIAMQDLDGRILAWNPGATRLYGWTEAEALTMNMRELIAPPLRDQAQEVVRRLSQAEILEPYRTQRIDKAGRTVNVALTATAVVNAAGDVYAIATTERRVEGEADA
jgi:two-component system CheB/CheR fusion protein